MSSSWASHPAAWSVCFCSFCSWLFSPSRWEPERPQNARDGTEVCARNYAFLECRGMSWKRRKRAAPENKRGGAFYRGKLFPFLERLAVPYTVKNPPKLFFFDHVRNIPKAGTGGANPIPKTSPFFFPRLARYAVDSIPFRVGFPPRFDGLALFPFQRGGGEFVRGFLRHCIPSHPRSTTAAAKQSASKRGVHQVALSRWRVPRPGGLPVHSFPRRTVHTMLRLRLRARQSIPPRPPARRSRDCRAPASRWQSSRQEPPPLLSPRGENIPHACPRHRSSPESAARHLGLANSIPIHPKRPRARQHRLASRPPGAVRPRESTLLPCGQFRRVPGLLTPSLLPTVRKTETSTPFRFLSQCQDRRAPLQFHFRGVRLI